MLRAVAGLTFLACARSGEVFTAAGFQAYYTYTGDLAVTGTVGPMTTASKKQTFYYSLTGVDEGCESGPSTVLNSCGIHIHVGASCLTDAGGHYFNVAADPWKTITYTSGAGSHTVRTGLTAAEVRGKAMIIHDRAGGRIACALLQSGAPLDVGDGTLAPPAVQAVFTASLPYLTYIGPMAVVGTVGPMSTASGTQRFTYELEGVDAGCASGPSGTPNSCGIHIHAERTCTAPAGGHYYDGASLASDPWATVVYTTGSGYLSVQTGYTAADINGRAMIIHNKAGERVACAILGALTPVVLTAAGFQAYYTYTGALAVMGTVGPVTTAGTTQTLYYSLSGVDPACASGASSAANSCGLHIHMGSRCTADAGPHHYNALAYSDATDPWRTATYTKGAGALTVGAGLTAADIRGKAVIIHDRAGGRIACALLQSGAPLAKWRWMPHAADDGKLVQPAVQAGAFVPYVGYVPRNAPVPRGVVGPMRSEDDGRQTFYFELEGVDAGCASGPSGTPNSCGIHIHAERTCTAPAGGHYYDGASLASDPWATVVYTTGSGYLSVQTGYTAADINGRAMIIHNKAGERVACAILGALTPASPAMCPGVCTGNPVEACGYDPTCAEASAGFGGGLGCNAGGWGQQCRFCGFGGFAKYCPACKLGAVAGVDGNGVATTCGARIEWLQAEQGLSEDVSRDVVAAEFPAECGACRKTVGRPPTPSCDAEADAGGYSCRARMRWLMSAVGLSAAAAGAMPGYTRAKVEAEFPEACRGCTLFYLTPAMMLGIGATAAVILLGAAGMAARVLTRQPPLPPSAWRSVRKQSWSARSCARAGMTTCAVTVGGEVEAGAVPAVGPTKRTPMRMPGAFTPTKEAPDELVRLSQRLSERLSERDDVVVSAEV